MIKENNSLILFIVDYGMLSLLYKRIRYRRKGTHKTKTAYKEVTGQNLF